jgi:integrase
MPVTQFNGKLYYREAKVCTCKGDLRKQWYVWYYIGEESDKLKLRKKYIPNDIKDYHSRFAYAMELQELINIGLKKAGKQPREATPLISQAFEQILEWKASHCRPRTMDSYRSASRMFLQELRPGKMKINELSSALVSSTLEKISVKRKWKPKTYNLNVSYLKTLVDRAVEREWIETNPFAKIKALPETEVIVRLWSEQDLETFFNYTEQNAYGLYITAQLIYKCGLRPMEISMLRVENIDFTASLIWVEGYGAKNRKRQPVTLPKRLAEELKEYVQGYEKHDFLLSTHPTPGKNVGRNYISRKFAELKEQLGLHPDLNIYSLKHTGALMMDSMGLTPKEIQEQLRHHSIAQTDQYMRRLKITANEKLMDW